jgi:hypothetical protein
MLYSITIHNQWLTSELVKGQYINGWTLLRQVMILLGGHPDPAEVVRRFEACPLLLCMLMVQPATSNTV